MVDKIVIATPVDYSNFGNRLQNYAVHEVCKKLGWDPITAAVEYAYIKGKIAKHTVLEIVDRLNVYPVISRVPQLKSLTKSLGAYRFTKRYIKTQYVCSHDDLEKVCRDAKYGGIGGDQVLAPYWRKIIWFATFPDMAPDHKVCFAPSFGSDKLPQEHLEEVVGKEIPTIKHFAVREASGVSIAKQYANVDAVRICDPVVLLTKDEWLERCRDNGTQQDKKYGLVYFLGNKDQNYSSAIQEYSAMNGCSLIDVSKYSQSSESTCDPFAFISYMHRSEIVFTDSFHAVMFALILNKKVVIFDRVGGQEMNTRIEDLINRFGLRSCKYQPGESMDGQYDTELVNSILSDERKKAYEYYKQFN